MKKPNTHPVQICGPDCTYRALYEGSQRSLTDAAARAGTNITALAHWRHAVTRSLKRFFPLEFNEAQSTLATKFSEIPDDLMIAYLESFLQMAVLKAPASASEVARLRGALIKLGIDVKGAFTVGALVQALENHSPAIRSKPAALDDIFISPPVTFVPIRQAFPPAPVSTPVPPLTTESSTRNEAAEQTTAHTPDTYASDEYANDEYEDSGYAPQEPQPQEPQPQEPQPQEPGLQVTEAHGEEDDFTNELFDTPPSQVQMPRASLDDLFAPGSPPTRKAKETPAPRPDTLVGPWAPDATLSPLKPQIPPTPQKPKSRTTKRTPRTSVQPPVPTPNPDLNDDIRGELLAAVCIPRPVFSADLANLVGSSDVVAAWEAEWGSATELPIRFIGPKPRHKARGSLIIPQGYLCAATPEFKQSLWARTLTTYKGAKAYELGVLLHRYIDEVQSDELGTHVALFHLLRPQGLVGVVVVLDTSLGAGAPTRLALCSALDALMRERLVQTAVLTTNAEIIDTIAEVVAEEATLRQWLPTSPVTLSKSWDFASGAGVAIPLLGA
jgi:hypothetical protein